MKIFSRFLHFFILIICLLVQIVFFEYLKMFYINFDLIMVVIIAVTVFDGTLWGILLGFIAGMTLDLMVSDIAGISAFIYAIDAFIAGRLITVGFKSVKQANLFMVFLVTEINILLINLIYYLFNFNPDWFGTGIELMTKPFFNIILMFAVFPVMKIISGRREEIGFEYKSKI
jgi:rod shape-determining protein MreD